MSLALFACYTLPISAVVFFTLCLLICVSASKVFDNYTGLGLTTFLKTLLEVLREKKAQSLETDAIARAQNSPVAIEEDNSSNQNNSPALKLPYCFISALREAWFKEALELSEENEATHLTPSP